MLGTYHWIADLAPFVLIPAVLGIGALALLASVWFARKP